MPLWRVPDANYGAHKSKADHRETVRPTAVEALQIGLDEVLDKKAAKLVKGSVAKDASSLFGNTNRYWRGCGRDLIKKATVHTLTLHKGSSASGCKVRGIEINMDFLSTTSSFQRKYILFAEFRK